MDYTEKPDYSAVVDIVTKSSIRELATPATLAVMAPIIVGFLLKAEALGAFLAGAILTGQLMAVMLSNAGGAWDNAKKLVEDGAYGGKGSETHKATVIGDTVGDPFKDTAGPALNPMIKVMNLVALLVVPVVVTVSSSSAGDVAVRLIVGFGATLLLAAVIWMSKSRRPEDRRLSGPRGGLRPGSSMRRRRFVDRLTETDEDRLAADIREWADTVPGSVRMAEAPDRKRVKLAGAVRRITIRPVMGFVGMRLLLFDGTGEVSVVFLGRRSIPGLTLGSRLVVEGVLGRSGSARGRSSTRASSSFPPTTDPPSGRSAGGDLLDAGPQRPAVADAGVGDDQARPRGIRLDLLAQLADEDTEHLEVVLVPRSPHVLEQPPVGQQLPGVTGERLQQRPLGAREPHGAVATDRTDRFSRSISTSPSRKRPRCGGAAAPLRRSSARTRARNSSMPKGLVR